jgi:hypothetical protein
LCENVLQKPLIKDLILASNSRVEFYEKEGVLCNLASMAILRDSLARISMHLLHPVKNLILASSEEEKVKKTFFCNARSG